MNPRVEQIVQRFADVVEAYDRGRPNYASEAIDFLVKQFSVTSETRILDVGAGTGKLTGQIVATGAEVLAVEPVQGMRMQLATSLPIVQIVEGQAEAIRLRGDSVDVIACGQSFHWFSTKEALREFHRILRPRGGLALLWNETHLVPWVVELKQILAGYAKSSREADASETWQADFEQLELFSPLTKLEFRHAQLMNEETLIAAISSRSYIATLQEADRRKILDDVVNLVRTHPDIAGRKEFELPHITELYWSRASTDEES